MRRIAVLRAGALGDTVLTLPAIRALRSAHSGARIEVIGYPSLWEVADHLVDAIHPIDGPPFSDLYAVGPSPAVERWLDGVDLFIAWTARDLSPTLRSPGTRFIAGSPYPPPGVHAVAWLLQMLELPEIDAGTPIPLLSFSAAEHRAARDRLRAMGLHRPVWLHPGAGATWKRWPAQHFGAVARALQRNGREVALIDGPADAGAIAAMDEATAFPVLREASPRALAGILSLGTAYLGNDSGPTHLAAASGLPTVALFGPTDPASWAPLGNVTVLRACTVAPRHRGQIRICDDPHCMAGIGTEDALRALTAALPS